MIGITIGAHMGRFQQAHEYTIRTTKGKELESGDAGPFKAPAVDGWRGAASSVMPPTDREDMDKFRAEMEAIGVSVAAPQGIVDMRNDGWAVVGSILLRGGLIRVVPRLALTMGQSSRLLAAVAQVWMHGRGVLPGWQLRPRLGWVTDVKIHHPQAQSECSASNAARWSPDALVPEISAGLSRPVGW